MKPLRWPQWAALAGLVAGVHGWAIHARDPRPEPPRVVAAAAAAGPVMVMTVGMSAGPTATPKLAVQDAPPGPPQAPSQAPTETPAVPKPRRVIAAASLEPPATRPAFVAAPQAEGAVPVSWPLAPPLDEARDPTEAAPPPTERLAQARPVTSPADPEPGEPPVPTYRSQPPGAAKLAYRLSRGPIVGTGQIDWQPAPGGAYRLQLEGSVPIVGTLITQTSQGRIDATGLAPERHTDRRLRRGEQAANFDRAAGRIRFSGQAPELPLTAGVQDRVSVMIQLPAIVNAWTRVPPVGEHVLIRVVGARGDAHVWSLRFDGLQAVELPDGRVNTLHFLREPQGPNDTRAEFWLDPARQHLPVKVRLIDGKGEALELLRMP